MKIEFDQSNASLGVLQGENRRLRDKYDQISMTLKDVTESYEEKIKEYTSQIN